MNVVVNMDNIFKNNIQTLKKINKLKFSTEIAIGKKIKQ
jgi:predicted transcriptional regulator